MYNTATKIKTDQMISASHDALTPYCSIEAADFRQFLDELDYGSVDLLLTDPPYTISRKTGFQQLGPNSVERFAVSMDFGKWDHGIINLEALCNKGHNSWLVTQSSGH